MADLSIDQVKEFLGNLTVLELADLVKALEEEWGVSAAAPVAVAAVAVWSRVELLPEIRPGFRVEDA